MNEQQKAAARAYWTPERLAVQRAWEENQRRKAESPRARTARRRAAFNSEYTAACGDAWRVVTRHVYICITCDRDFERSKQHCITNHDIWTTTNEGETT